MKHLAIIGAGSWGTALAVALSTRFRTIRIWTRSADQAAEISAARENRRYLPGFHLAENIGISSDLEAATAHAEIILLAVPSSYLRATLDVLRPHFSDSSVFVSATKGIEQGTLCRMSEVITQALRLDSNSKVAVLSGPTFAAEIASGEPAAVVIASASSELATHIQQAFATRELRLYTTSDVTGVESAARSRT